MNRKDQDDIMFRKNKNVKTGVPKSGYNMFETVIVPIVITRNY